MTELQELNNAGNKLLVNNIIDNFKSVHTSDASRCWLFIQHHWSCLNHRWEKYNRLTLSSDLSDQRASVSACKYYYYMREAGGTFQLPVILKRYHSSTAFIPFIRNTLEYTPLLFQFALRCCKVNKAATKFVCTQTKFPNAFFCSSKVYKELKSVEYFQHNILPWRSAYQWFEQYKRGRKSLKDV